MLLARSPRRWEIGGSPPFLGRYVGRSLLHRHLPDTKISTENMVSGQSCSPKTCNKDGVSSLSGDFVTSFLWFTIVVEWRLGHWG